MGTSTSSSVLSDLATMSATPLNVLVIHNPASRINRQDLDHALERGAPSAASLIVRETSVDRSIADLVEDDLEWASIVVAAGGDGTVSAVAAGLFGTGIPLGIIPAGTTNMVAKVNRVPGDTMAAVSLLFGDHRIETIDAGRSNGRALLHIGGAGIDARIFQKTSTGLKRRLRWLGYGPPALSALREPSSKVTVTVDGRTVMVASRLMLIANSASLIHPRFTIFPKVRRDDGVFDVLLFTAGDVPAILSTAASLAMRRLQRSQHVIHLQGRRISVSAEPELPFEFDGDVVGNTPFQLIVEPMAIRMICGR